jgi:hypothetical protein
MIVDDSSRAAFYAIRAESTFRLLLVLEKLHVGRFPSINYEDLNNYTWRVFEKTEEEKTR